MELYVVISSYGQWDDYGTGVSGIFVSEELAKKAIEYIQSYYRGIKDNEPFEVKEARMMLDKEGLDFDDEQRYEDVVFRWECGELKEANDYNDSWIQVMTMNKSIIGNNPELLTPVK